MLQFKEESVVHFIIKCAKTRESANTYPYLTKNAHISVDMLLFLLSHEATMKCQYMAGFRNMLLNSQSNSLALVWA